MFEEMPHIRYKHDSTFSRVVDMLRVFLSQYHLTPGELREAIILAATMHEAENVRPLYIWKDELAMLPTGSLAMFGGAPLFDIKGCESGRIQSSKPNFTEVPKTDLKCICGKNTHSQACKDYNWAYYHPKRHIWGERRLYGGNTKTKPYRICITCGLSDAYAGTDSTCKA